MTEELFLTPLDESYGHQLVAPRAVTAHVHASWQERCYHLLYAGDGLMLDMGRSLWAHQGRRRAFLGVNDSRRQYCVRTEEPFALGDDVDAPSVGGISIEAVEPLRRVRLGYGTAETEVEVALTYTARFAPVANTPLRIEQDGEIVTDYMNFFQPGSYDGWIRIGSERREVRDRLGFRDRGWGVRKHEGAPARGLVLGVFCELPDAALYVLLFETASGRRVLEDGWLIEEGGVTRVAAIEHELSFDGVLLREGALGLRMADGGERRLGFRAEARLFLAGVGYSADPARTAPRVETFDLDPRTEQLLRGQTDHGCSFDLDGVGGHGYVETGLGTHARYLPDPETP